ncbi:hypothetical protein LIER_29747 [Lithospermum erythrorhizon]|uniref:Reverse transcriptase domain-containing protein n=1 Tax=Lithospermum erythrorhizon TaxID=34254 RepID=A0AAV3RKD4_LITER
MVIFVYPVYSVPRRRDLWEYLTQLGASITSPWIVLRDFNCFLFPQHKRVGQVLIAYLLHGLKEFVMATSLVDAPSSGSFYTWTNGSLWPKLDRPQRGSRSFKFYNMWLTHPSFAEVRDSLWETEIRGTAQYVLCGKLKLLKKPLRKLNRDEFGGISDKTSRAKEAFKVTIILQMATPIDSALKEEAERTFFRQKARCTHLVEGGRSTKYFHAMVNKNKQKNSISYLVKFDVTRTTSKEEVATLLVDFFTRLMGIAYPSSPIDLDVLRVGPLVGMDSHTTLGAPVSDEEIRWALFDIGDERAPSPDGFTAAFFKANWDIVREDVVKAVREFYTMGRLLRQLNHTIIALIPKIDRDPGVGDFRPIGCANVVYKIITKILAKRMEALLSSLIDRSQGAFIRGRSLVNDVFLAQEIVRGYSVARTFAWCMLMMDLRKAYDTVSWEFLEAVLRGLDFPKVFVGWVIECVTTASYSVSINGEMHGHFPGRRGLRQGDPMSSALFLLCLEYFSRICRARAASPSFAFHPMCGEVGITHIAFVDDLMLFLQGGYLFNGYFLGLLISFGAMFWTCSQSC